MGSSKKDKFKGFPKVHYSKVPKKERLTYLRECCKHGKALDYDPVSRRAAFEGWKLRNLPPIDKQLCYLCDSIPEHWHHIKQVSRGGWDCSANLVPLCMRCHKRVHRFDVIRRNRMAQVPKKFTSPLVKPYVLIEFVPKCKL